MSESVRLNLVSLLLVYSGVLCGGIAAGILIGLALRS